MFVEVYKLGEEQDAVTSFRQGSHVVGRGPALQCNDKRVSRNHATIEVAPNEVKITSNHVNPCFLKVVNSKTVTILPKDSSSQLHDGDTFAFLPDTLWFKIKIVEDAVSDSSAEQCSKRPLDEVEEEMPEKRQKLQENEPCDGTECNGAEPQTEVKLEAEESILKNTGPTDSHEIVEADNTVKTEQEEDNCNKNANPASDNNVEADNTVKEEDDSKEETACDSTNGTIKEEQTGSQVDDGTGPSTSNTKSSTRRERCWYGAQCYRKNPIHRQDFTHPGDSDFESDPDDTRPSCSFGASCYRKNKDHRREYKHPPREPPSKKKRTRKKVDRLNVGGNDNDDDDLSDVSEDPYAVDGDSDEYVQDSEDDDTDWEDSQNVDEDSENMRNLVKEAKRFTKK